jgi:hypothetical protein
MRRGWMVKKAILFLLAASVAVTLFGFVVMGLWNWLMPAVFGLTTLGFWQAVGLLVLFRILFGGIRGGHGGRAHHWRHRMLERWEKMTPEEREQFRAGLRGRCGRRFVMDLGQDPASEPPPAQPTA